MKKKFIVVVGLLLVVFFFYLLYHTPKKEIHKPKGKKVSMMVEYGNPQAQDQDDMCIWIHPTKPTSSLIIVADKVACKIFVYSVDGKVKQTLNYQKPGNIDIRYNFPFNDEKIDIVATTIRGEKNQIVIFQIDDKNFLKRIDDGSGNINMDRYHKRRSFGGSLYRSVKNNAFYFFKTDEDHHEPIEQFKLQVVNNKISLMKVRAWESPGKCEGAVADDEYGTLYVCDEKNGIYKYSANPQQALTKQLIFSSKKISLEGITIYKTSAKEGYIIASLQSHNSYIVLDRATNQFIAFFHTDRLTRTDGIDVTHVDIHPQLKGGFFIAHTTPRKPNCPIMATSWTQIAQKLNLKIQSTYEIRW